MGAKEYYQKKKAQFQAAMAARERARLEAQERRAKHLEKKASKAAKMQAALERQEKANKTIQKAAETKKRVNPNFFVKVGQTASSAAQHASKVSKALPKKTNSLFGADMLPNFNSNKTTQQQSGSMFSSSNMGLDFRGGMYAPEPAAPKPRKKRRKKRKTNKKRRKKK